MNIDDQILAYLSLYQELLDAEANYEELPIYTNQLKYIQVHAEYEKALGQILKSITPIELAENISKISNACKSAMLDLARYFELGEN